MSETYLGNPNLKKANVTQEWTKKELIEYQRCMEDPLYFIQNYVQIVSLDEGLIPFKMYDFQKEMVGTFHSNRFTICKLPRQTGKSTTMVSYLLHYALFNPSVNIAILANKAATARDLLGRFPLISTMVLMGWGTFAPRVGPMRNMVHMVWGSSCSRWCLWVWVHLHEL